MIFNNSCDIYRHTIVTRDFEEIREVKLMKQGVPCFISLNTNRLVANLDEEATYTISLPIDNEVFIGDEIISGAEKFLVEKVVKRKFSSTPAGSLKIIAKIL